MEIGGFLKSSLIDYPDKIAAVVFTRGCPFRCPYCHNPQLVDPDRYLGLIPEDQVIRHLERRKGKLQGVVVTGGEPTSQEGLLNFLERIKILDYPVKLDTNGVSPGILIETIGRRMVHYLAMDIKAPISRYREVVRAAVDVGAIQRSVSLIRASGLPYEYRTTWDRSLLCLEDMKEIAQWIEGGEAWYVQTCRPGDNLESDSSKAASSKDMDSLRDHLAERSIPWRLR
jgi:pyruvate formate lyase activating enzyme